jgi:hypothetical protein
MNNLLWLQQWYLGNTNGDWEHTYGLLIKTLDNPGWRVEIDLLDTPFADLPPMPYTLYEAADDDWFTLEVQDGLFRANGDPTKLDLIIGKFRELISRTPPGYEQPGNEPPGNALLLAREPAGPRLPQRLWKRRRRARAKRRDA